MTFLGRTRSRGLYRRPGRAQCGARRHAPAELRLDLRELLNPVVALHLGAVGDCRLDDAGQQRGGDRLCDRLGLVPDGHGGLGFLGCRQGRAGEEGAGGSRADVCGGGAVTGLEQLVAVVHVGDAHHLGQRPIAALEHEAHHAVLQEPRDERGRADDAERRQHALGEGELDRLAELALAGDLAAVGEQRDLLERHAAEAQHRPPDAEAAAAVHHLARCLDGRRELALVVGALAHGGWAWGGGSGRWLRW